MGPISSQAVVLDDVTRMLRVALEHTEPMRDPKIPMFLGRSAAIARYEKSADVAQRWTGLALRRLGDAGHGYDDARFAVERLGAELEIARDQYPYRFCYFDRRASWSGARDGVRKLVDGGLDSMPATGMTDRQRVLALATKRVEWPGEEHRHIAAYISRRVLPQLTPDGAPEQVLIDRTVELANEVVAGYRGRNGAWSRGGKIGVDHAMYGRIVTNLETLVKLEASRAARAHVASTAETAADALVW